MERCNHTTGRTLLLVAGFAVSCAAAVLLSACTGSTGGVSIRTPYGDVTSGTVNLDLTPLFPAQEQMPPPISYNAPKQLEK